jgi:hypothetical protein
MKSTSICILLSLVLFSCDRLFIDDITDVTIGLVTPYDNQIFNTPDVSFSWNEVKDAEYYQLVVVSPEFNAIFDIICDTNINNTFYSEVFPPGKYQWHINAFNYHSMSCSDTFSFTIDSSGSVINNTPTIIQPKNLYSNTTKIKFEWSNITSAEFYRFEIKEDSWQNTTLFYVVDHKDNNLELELQEGGYYWGVQSKYQNLHSGYAYQQLIVDTTPPTKPVITTPENETTVSTSNVTFNWSHESSGTSPVFDSIFISTNESFTSGILSKKAENTEISIDLENGTYYWFVRSFDMAGNISDDSQIFTFSVNE